MQMTNLLTGPMVYGFVGACLISRFDEPAPIPNFHKELWEMCCSDEGRIAVAAPRGHSKSTSITLSYLLATIVFRERQYALIISDTEGQAVQFLGDLKNELLDNEHITALFGKVELVKDSETKIVGRFEDGHTFRIEAKGSEQKLRGVKWNHRRPDLIICHEEGTRIFADGKWMNNQDHPKAHRVKTSGYKVTYEDGTTEVISKDHRYWIEGTGWVFANDLQLGMEVGGCRVLMTKEEREIADIMQSGELTIKKRLELSKLHIENEIKKLLKKGTLCGSMKIKTRIKLISTGIILRIRYVMMQKLKGMLKRTKDGKHQHVQRDEL